MALRWLLCERAVTVTPSPARQDLCPITGFFIPLFIRSLARLCRYEGHDPARIPVRFVWKLLDFATLQRSKPFMQLVSSCNEMLGVKE